MLLRDFIPLCSPDQIIVLFDCSQWVAFNAYIDPPPLFDNFIISDVVDFDHSIYSEVLDYRITNISSCFSSIFCNDHCLCLFLQSGESIDDILKEVK